MAMPTPTPTTTTTNTPTSSPSSDTDVAVVYSTAPSHEVAKALARHLVESKLAACVNVVPGLTSVYTWKGKIEEDSEVLLIIKTRKNLVEDLTRAVKEEHPYDEPEVLALPAIGGSETYLRWVVEATKK